MNEKAKVRLVYVDQDYLDILRSVENKVSTKNRPYVFLGIIINEHLYCIPLTSQTNRARARRGLRKRPNTFTENIIGPRGYAVAVLLYGNMIPVKENVVTDCEIGGGILKDEWIFIRKNADRIIEKALRVYRSRVSGKNPFANLWCCDFKRLEECAC